MKPKVWRVLEIAVEEGVATGIRRFLKHHQVEWIPEVDEVLLRESIIDHVMTSTCEWFEFDSSPETEE